MSQSHSVNVGAVLDTFDLLIMLGEGSQGQVWLARNPEQPGELIALKLLHPDGKDRSASLLRWEALGDHPNIVRVLETHWAAQPYFSMGYVDGPSLRMVLEMSWGKPIPLPVTMHIMRGILQALAFAHGGPGRDPVVHGGLNPDSVLIETATGTAKLDDFDFGASEGPADAVRNRMTDRLRHLTPEQLADHPATVQTDLYAAGLLLYELLCGVGPFDDLPMLSLLSPGTRARPFTIDELPAGTPPALLAVLSRALAPEPADRFTSARDMLAGLQSYMPTWDEGSRQVTRFTAQLGRHSADALDSVEPIPPSLVPWWEPALERTDGKSGEQFADATAVSMSTMRSARLARSAK